MNNFIFKTSVQVSRRVVTQKLIQLGNENEFMF